MQFIFAALHILVDLFERTNAPSSTRVRPQATRAALSPLASPRRSIRYDVMCFAEHPRDSTR